MKKDIFNGKIKQEYFSYILVYMIFFVLLFAGIGVLAIYAAVWGMSVNSSGERMIMGAIGVVVFMLAPIYLVLELLVIRRYPKYEKLRRALFNSDCYFTESNSTEYRGGNRRRAKAAFALVTSFAAVEKAMGKKRPIQYTIYLLLSIFMSLLGLVLLIGMPLLFENGSLPPWLSESAFWLCCIFGGIACVVLAIIFYNRAYTVALRAIFGNLEWGCELHKSLADISVRRNNKKHKFWYKASQIQEIEDLIHAANENEKFHAELKLKRKGNRLVSFEVFDTSDDRVEFTGLFIK